MTMRFRFIVLILLPLLIIFSVQHAAAEKIADRQVLPNGITLLHAEKNALPIVTVVIAIKAGSLMESPEKGGLANLTARLLNEGTKTRSSLDISSTIEFVGGSLGASGGTDYMTVTLSVLKKDIELGFDLLGDIILNPVFNDAEIKRQKAIIKSAIIQQKEDPGAIASKAFMEAVFGSHPYGRPPEGTENSLDMISRADIVDFHSAYYRPNNTIMTVVGDIDKVLLGSLIDKYLGHWQKKEIVFPPLPAIAHQENARVIKINKDITQANIILGHVGITRDHPDYYAVSVMNYILGGGGFSSRLMDNIRDNKGLAYSVYSFFSANKYAGDFQAGLQTRNESANTAIDEILREIRAIRDEPVTDRELEDAKSYLTGSFPLRIDSNKKIAGFLTAVEYYGLGLDYVDNYKHFINAVTKDDILRVAREYLHPGKYVLVVVGNIGKSALQY